MDGWIDRSKDLELTTANFVGLIGAIKVLIATKAVFDATSVRNATKFAETAALGSFSFVFVSGHEENARGQVRTQEEGKRRRWGRGRGMGRGGER